MMHNPPVLSGRRLFRCSLVALVALAAAALVGCGTTTDDRPAKWSFISPAITEPSCATVNCHSAIAQKAERPSDELTLVVRCLQPGIADLTGRFRWR